MIEKVVSLTIGEFIRLYDREGPFEVVNGEVIKLSPNVTGHNVTAKILLMALENHNIAHHTGETFIETPFALTDSSDWVKGSRVPDVMFVRAERMAAYKASIPDWADKPLLIVPDLVIEIVSPTDSFTDVNDKVESYLRDGVKLAWIVDRHRRRVTVYQAGNQQQTTLTAADTLDGGDVIPGFVLLVGKLFE